MTLDPRVIHRFLADARSAPTSDAKGKLYEELTKYLFEAVPGCIAEANVTNVFDTEQIDVAVGNGKLPNGLNLLPSVLLVECKDWSARVDSKTVGYFMSILAGRGVELGVLVAANGITGSPNDLTNAHAIGLHSARVTKIIVITTDEIAGLRSVTEFVELLHRRYLKAFATGTIGVP
ncbi:restriction endonuclease [Frankia sp. AgB1.9]|uniref:restriction endonuclease n=1 Tax=unclassified Frankia TaxID=2632575 RepID=UPI0019313777|nr:MULTISPECIES: restriction endonuclease [unclassified Frankia]MBL7491558.1 restriction endonuclease [Frankia sp. AgW1.1]MBL7553801.1 restriction endonuclease [Frankia sp. AgB1.9]MBL7617901.1 restriction endonuclease [Frankia sp. AgB1.8]